MSAGGVKVTPKVAAAAGGHRQFNASSLSLPPQHKAYYQALARDSEKVNDNIFQCISDNLIQEETEEDEEKAMEEIHQISDYGLDDDADIAALTKSPEAAVDLTELEDLDY